MNVLSDILCDSSSLMVSQSYKGALSHGKIMSPEDDMVVSKQEPLQLLDTLPSIERPLSLLNQSSPSDIDLFNSSDHIHIPPSMDSSFDERNQSSVFTSNLFPEIVPSWLAHDFMKVSDNLPSPGMLSAVSDIYPSRENEHLEMLDLGFQSELTPHDVMPDNLARTCIDNGHKLLSDLNGQRFQPNEALIIPSFSNINSSHLHISVNKNTMHYQKYKENTHHSESTRSLLNAVLPCENELLHLPLPPSLTEQCLNMSSSPSMISNKQSQSQPVDVVCDKLPQISLNHLDSLLGSDNAMSAIQLLRHDFPDVHIDDCNPTPMQPNENECHVTEDIVTCHADSFLTSAMPSVARSQDISVQVSENVPQINFVPGVENCVPCSKVSPSMVEVIKCFKCKFCDFISIHKCSIVNHINLSHSESAINIEVPTSSSLIVANSISSENTIPSLLPLGGQNETPILNSDSLVAVTTATPNSNPNIGISVMPYIAKELTNVLKKTADDRFVCLKCNALFLSMNDCKQHLANVHKLHVHVSKNNSSNCQLATSEQSNMSKILNKVIITFPSNGKYIIPQNDQSKKQVIPQRRIASKKPEDSPIKANSKKSNASEGSRNSVKPLSSHKKAWQNKMTRELGSYICEFKGCNVRFRALDNLEYHRKCHMSGNSSFVCPECGLSFENWRSIAGHLWRTHSNDMELHKCDQCSFRSYSLGRLENYHKRIHRNEYLFLCDTCGKSFKTGKQLQNHRGTHFKSLKQSGTFQCNICMSVYKTMRTLRVHYNTVHNSVKPFVCTFCEYSTNKRSTMKLHMRQHTGEKPFKCDTCDYCTGDHSTLRRHKITHSGEKPYKCPYCSYSSIQASCYKDHLKKHPGQNDGLMFSCTQCSFRTIKRENYLTHLEKHKTKSESYETCEELFSLAEVMDSTLSQGSQLNRGNS